MDIKDNAENYSMVFEFAEGGTLHHYLLRHFGSLTWKDKYKLGLEITDGLQYLHELNIIHKDLVILFSFIYMTV